MTGLNFISFLLIGLVGAQVTIEPQNIVVRPDQVTRILCKTRTPIKSCLWEINGDLYNLQEDSPYEQFGVLEDGECGIQARVSETESGRWSCRVFLAGTGRSPAESASTNVTVLALPVITISPRNDPITVEAGQTAPIECRVADARPAPGIMWTLDDRDLEVGNQQAIMVHNPTNGKVTITSTLMYAFQANDHAKTLRCVTTGPWLTVDDPREAAVRLNVIFPPQPKEPTTLYGYVLGQGGEISVNFSSNPRPNTVYWKIDGEPDLYVEPYSRNNNQRYEVMELTNSPLNQTSFEARLRIKSVSEQDARRVFRLVVESQLDNDDVKAQEYVVHVSTSPAPVQCNPNQIDCVDRRTDADSRSDLAGAVSGGGIAAIIIVVLAILVITAVILYARNTGRWCFAAGKGVGVDTKDNVDEEAGQTGGEDGPDGTNGDVKMETSQRQSLSHRLSSLYESLLSKTAPKKSNSASSTGVGNAGADPDAKDGAIVYAELDLKAPAEGTGTVPEDASVRLIKEQATEYAEIVPIKPAGTSPAKTTE